MAGRNAKYSDTLIRRARLLHKRGYTAREVQQHLIDEGTELAVSTIANWLKFRDRLTPECLP